MEKTSTNNNSKVSKTDTKDFISGPVEVTLLTYNIFMKPASLKRKTNHHKNTRLKLFTKLLNRFDIINFQEIHKDLSKRRDKMIKAAEEEGYKYVAIPKRHPVMSTFTRGSGLLTLSKFKILNSGFMRYKDIKSYAFQGVAYSKIELLNGNILHLFNTHLQSTEERKYKSKEKKLYRTRLKQILQMREIIDHFLEENSDYNKSDSFKDLILITGDFSLNARNCMLPVNDMNLEKLKNVEINKWIEENKVENPVEEDHCFSEYEFLKFSLSKFNKDRVNDVVFKSMNNVHPVTYGDCFNKNRKTVPRETVLTSKLGRNSEKCLDYIFQIIPGLQEGIEEKDFEFECKILPFFVDMEDEEEIENKVTQLSNHYGIRLKFKF